jgi:hypothetical protein
MPSHAELMNHAAEVARQLISYDGYGGSRSRAEAALRRRAPGFSAQEHRRALEKAIAMYLAARAIVAKRYWDLSRDAMSERHLTQIRRDHPGFSRATYAWVTDWAIREIL